MSVPTTLHTSTRNRSLWLVAGCILATVATALAIVLVVRGFDGGPQAADRTGSPQSVPTRESVLRAMSPEGRRYTKAVIALTPAQLAAGAAGSP